MTLRASKLSNPKRFRPAPWTGHRESVWAVLIVCEGHYFGELDSQTPFQETNRELISDIFGLMNNTQQGADILATQLGCRVAMPDFFNGKPWELSKFPPPDRDEFLAWIGKTQWPQVEPVLLKTMGFLREDGAKKFGMTQSICPPSSLSRLSSRFLIRLLTLLLGLYGFCWGGKMASKATKYVGAAAMVHPA